MQRGRRTKATLSKCKGCLNFLQSLDKTGGTCTIPDKRWRIQKTKYPNCKTNWEKEQGRRG